MRRPSKPWYRSFNDTWYVCLNGKQIPLVQGKANKKEAERVFHRLMAGETPQFAKPTDLRVVAVLDLFLEHAHTHNAPRTYYWYRNFLQDFSNRCGNLRVEELKPFHVSRWLDAHSDWGTARWGAITAVKRAFNWAVDEGLLGDSPVKKLKKPPMPARDRFLTVQERGKIVDNYRHNDPFRDFLFAMEQTGCRPGELAVVTAADVDLVRGAWVLDEHKTVSKTAEQRVIILTAAMLALTQTLMAKHPEGPLFRNAYGDPWTGNAIRCRFRRVRQKLQLGDDLVAYLYRHAVCTDLLESGAGIAQVAEILGHKGTDMIMRHYSKLRDRHEHLRDQLQRARATPPGSTDA